MARSGETLRKCYGHLSGSARDLNLIISIFEHFAHLRRARVLRGKPQRAVTSLLPRVRESVRSEPRVRAYQELASLSQFEMVVERP